MDKYLKKADESLSLFELKNLFDQSTSFGEYAASFDSQPFIYEHYSSEAVGVTIAAQIRV